MVAQALAVGPPEVIRLPHFQSNVIRILLAGR